METAFFNFRGRIYEGYVWCIRKCHTKRTWQIKQRKSKFSALATKEWFHPLHSSKGKFHREQCVLCQEHPVHTRSNIFIDNAFHLFWTKISDLAIQYPHVVTTALLNLLMVMLYWAEVRETSWSWFNAYKWLVSETQCDYQHLTKNITFLYFYLFLSLTQALPLPQPNYSWD